MESEEQCHWLPVQVLNAVHNTATLPDATQVDVMKVSLPLSRFSCDINNQQPRICFGGLMSKVNEPGTVDSSCCVTIFTFWVVSTSTL